MLFVAVIYLFQDGTPGDARTLSLAFTKDVSIVISSERAWRELSIDMDIERSILGTYQA